MNPVRNFNISNGGKQKTMKISNGVNRILIINQNIKFLSILLIATLLVFYIFQVNNEISKRYLIKSYNQKISELTKENKNLEIKTVQINSLDKIIGLLAALNFEKTEKIHYIRILDKQVVSK